MQLVVRFLLSFSAFVNSRLHLLLLRHRLNSCFNVGLVHGIVYLNFCKKYLNAICTTPVLFQIKNQKFNKWSAFLYRTDVVV